MKSKEYFIYLLSSYINKRQPIYDNSINWNEILRLAQTHSVQALTYMVINKFEEKPSIYNELKEQFLKSVNISTVQEVYVNNLINILTANNIDHLFIKGYILRNYYPDKEARTFGDIDFLIDKKDRNKSHKLILESGFEFQKDLYDKDVWTYQKGVLNIEVHTDIIYHKLFNEFDYIDYFRSKISNKQFICGCTYELRKEDHFIYVLVHLAKHFYNAGVGIRMILDVVVFLQKYGKTMDFDYISRELSYIQLKDFTNIIFYICKKYFDSDVDCTPIEQNDLNKIMEYILNHGVFGFDNKDVQGIGFKKNGDKGIKLLAKKVFPDLLTMQKLYPWFNNGKKYMLPYAWVRRWLYFITNKKKRKSLSSKFAAIVDDSEDITKHIEMLKIAGLK